MSMPVVPYQCTGGPEKEVAMIAMRKASSALSIWGSSYILAVVFKKWRHNRASIDPYQRVVVGMSVYDIMWSFFPWFMGSWLVPAETGWWGAAGNQHTCSMQGFFFWLGVPGAQYYQILFSWHTLLLVTYGWKPHEFERRIERRAHKAIFAICLLLAALPLFFGAYNPECGTCLPAPLPIWCGDWFWGKNYFGGDGNVECLRGAPRLSEAYYSIYLLNTGVVAIFCTGSMAMVYRSVRRQEERVRQYSMRSLTHHRESQRIRRTMVLYTFGFFTCWVIPSIIIHFASADSPAHVVSYILLPLQGLFNMLVFIAPKCSKYQRDHPGTWLATAYFKVVFNVDGLRTCGAAVEDDDGIGFSGFNEEEPRGGRRTLSNFARRLRTGSGRKLSLSTKGGSGNVGGSGKDLEGEGSPGDGGGSGRVRFADEEGAPEEGGE